MAICVPAISARELRFEFVAAYSFDLAVPAAAAMPNCCYLLRSTTSKGLTYIGFTVDPRHRVRQHNGEVAGGANKTRRRGQVERVGRHKTQLARRDSPRRKARSCQRLRGRRFRGAARPVKIACNRSRRADAVADP